MKVKHSRKSSMLNRNAHVNPFEVRINRSKHNVLGRNLKSDKGMPGVSRHKAFKKRKDTLLQEYKLRHKTNNFIDQRIGERNSEMTEDDRIMARFTAERMRMFNKKTMFNLSDSEVLTHRGQTLSEIERFEDTRSDEEEDEQVDKSGSLRGKFVGDAHFGGGMLTKNKRDRESLIDELINESKKRKAERQRNKEETLEATEKLDEEWKILGQITTSANIEDKENNKTKEDGYDVVMRQLKFEPHGQASQRLKTDEEIAKEDREKLEKLELERLKQLREIEVNKFGYHRSSDDIDDGFTDLTQDFLANDEDNAEEDAESSENDVEDDRHSTDKYVNLMDEKNSNSECYKSEHKEKKVVIKESSKQKNKPSADNIQENKSSDNCKFISNLDSDNDVTSSDGSSDDECAMEDLTDLMPLLNETKISEGASLIKDNDETCIDARQKSDDIAYSSKEVDLDLPYVLDVPNNFESFKDLLNKHSTDQQNVIFERLLKSNHPNLGPGNKKKIFKLSDYIIQFVSEGDFPFDVLPNMVLHFSTFKEFNKEECLKLLVENFLLKLDDFDDTSPSEDSVKFLLWYIMLFLKPYGMDILLPVKKPALGLLCSVISQADLSSKSQVTLSLLCCYLLLQDAISSSTVYTDAIVFLESCIKRLVNVNSFTTNTKNRKMNKTEHSNGNKISPVKKNKSGSQEELKLPLTAQKEEDGCVDKQVLYLSTRFLSGFVKAYRKYPHSKIMFKNVFNISKEISTDIYPSLVKEAFAELTTLLDVLGTACLTPLVKTAKKPKALRQYEPSFHVVTDGKRSLKGLSAEKQEEQKLLHKYKSEMKGAMRELRRDRVFLANVKLGEKKRSDAERIKKVKEIFGSAAAQQGELRSLKRKK